MKFIELREYEYNGGCGSSTPILCNVNEISNVQDYNDHYTSVNAVVTMKNGKYYRVFDKYQDIIKMIVKASMED